MTEPSAAEINRWKQCPSDGSSLFTWRSGSCRTYRRLVRVCNLQPCAAFVLPSPIATIETLGGTNYAWIDNTQ